VRGEVRLPVGQAIDQKRCPHREPRLLSYPSSISLSTRTLNYLADLIRTHRHQQRSHWRRLTPGRQALLALAHLRNGDPFTRLAAGFGVGTTTAWRYVREVINLLADRADTLSTAMTRISTLAYAILDGTLIPIDRVADQKPYYSGKHRRHGVNVQVIADPAGRLVWASPALPGATHDLTAARTHQIVAALTSAHVMTFADRGYQGAGGPVRTPFKRNRRRQRLSRREKAVNRSHAQTRAIGERAIAVLKTWRLLTKLRCCPRRTTAIVQAILVLHHIEHPTYGR
jgi:DDE superfamily endonuclease/Helix-turn-helix of DDE superfamily endonuclease